MNHLSAFPIPRVGDLSCDACRTINRNGLLFQTDAADLEVSVAQPITERIERRSLLKKIPPPGGGLVVIECRNMSFRPGKADRQFPPDRKSTRLNSSHVAISYAVFC